jgi:hypothetical protein
LTTGEFLYGDIGESLSFQRSFSDTILRFDIAHTTHPLKGDNDVAKFTLTIPFGFDKYIKTDYLNIKTADLTYEKRKRIVNEGGDNAQALPHHLKELDNSFNIDKYYLDSNRLYSSYNKNNYQRLRNSFLNY